MGCKPGIRAVLRSARQQRPDKARTAGDGGVGACTSRGRRGCRQGALTEAVQPTGSAGGLDPCDFFRDVLCP